MDTPRFFQNMEYSGKISVKRHPAGGNAESPKAVVPKKIYYNAMDKNFYLWDTETGEFQQSKGDPNRRGYDIDDWSAWKQIPD